MMTRKNELQPLQELLDSVLARLDVLEQRTGVPSASGRTATATPPPIPVLSGGPAPRTSSHGGGGTVAPTVKAYDELLESSIKPLTASCDALGDMKNMGQLIDDAWTSIRKILLLSSRSKKPNDAMTELQPHLAPTQEAIKSIRSLRLDRKYDDHCKAIIESLGCLSWILISPPPQTPAAFVKEALASTEYWSNKIRKQYKTTDEEQVAFCNRLKDALNNLVEYITEHHKTGLAWNPRGVSLAEAAVTLEDDTVDAPPLSSPLTSPKSPNRRKYLQVVSGGTGGMSTLMAELERKRTADGSSAATGLKHVDRSQQTWRKEYQGEKSSVVPDKKPAIPAPTAMTKDSEKKKKRSGLPICEYQERGHKWVVEHQSQESSGGKVLKIEIADPKQQVYMYNCDNVTVQIEGRKLKSVILDKCTKCNVVFDTVISACEMVNCKRIQVQTLGVCPSFSIDKTEGCLVYLSKESLDATCFTTCQSTEMNVSFPDGNEQKELPIPEQFVHKLVNGTVSSEVSDLYH